MKKKSMILLMACVIGIYESAICYAAETEDIQVTIMENMAEEIVLNNETENEEPESTPSQEPGETKNIESCTYECPMYVYTGNEIEPTFSVYYEENQLSEGIDYEILRYENNVNAGTGKVIIEGIGDFAGERVLTFKIQKETLSGFQISKVKDKIYAGKPIKPEITVEDDYSILKQGKDYTVTYKNNNSIGTASFTVKGIGNYTGSLTGKFVINPQKGNISSVKKDGTGRLKISWKKVPGAQGYMLYRATSSSGTYSKIKTISGNSNVSYTNSGLKNNKKYYYKVRAYKKNGSKTYVGAYSSAKSGTTVKPQPKPVAVDTFPGTYVFNQNGRYCEMDIIKGDGYYVARTYGNTGLLVSSSFLYKYGSNYKAFFEQSSEVFFIISNISSNKIYVKYPYISKTSGWYYKK